VAVEEPDLVPRATHPRRAPKKLRRNKRTADKLDRRLARVASRYNERILEDPPEWHDGTWEARTA
jgi:hypothetical protein